MGRSGLPLAAGRSTQDVSWSSPVRRLARRPAGRWCRSAYGTDISEDFDIVPADEVDARDVVALMNLAFGREQTLDWYRWKHEEGPWGASRGWVAVKERSLVGVRLFTPWQMVGPARAFDVDRAFDGAVSPQARRQGIFSALVRAETEGAPNDPPRLVLSTSVPASRAAYSRLGWWGFEVAHRAAPRPLVHALRTAGTRSTTAWTPEAWEWRLDRRSGHDYSTDGVAPGGPELVYRVDRRRRGGILVLVHAAGTEDVVARVRTVAKRQRCRWVMAVGLSRTRSRDVGRSLVTGWNTGPSLDHPESWHLELADLEGVL
jgi:GNAT superfamily N-acetyltransferase